MTQSQKSHNNISACGSERAEWIKMRVLAFARVRIDTLGRSARVHAESHRTYTYTTRHVDVPTRKHRTHDKSVIRAVCTRPDQSPRPAESKAVMSCKCSARAVGANDEL